MRILFAVTLSLFLLSLSFAQTDASKVLRQEEMLEKDRFIRQELEKPEKFYIKEIIVSEPGCLSGQELETIILPFKKHWLTKDNIEQLVASLRQAYAENNCAKEPEGISYQIKKRRLIIAVKP